ncbi:MAG: chemotaxis protein CheW [Acidobacteria bacterium]|nr:chemotaxis protein CheW [Acidobacteriota bacterium]MBV9437909.1 chemotaxis protein CheW [Acidobacteriota bacterium]
MNLTLNPETFVLFPLGKKRFAFLAGDVSELARPDQAQTFPHTTPLLTGVVLRRNQIVPVADVAPALVGPDAPARKFYLVLNRPGRNKAGRTAIPVTGECELTQAERLPVTGKLPPYVCGLLSLQDEIVEVLDLDRLMAAEVRP